MHLKLLAVVFIIKMSWFFQALKVLDMRLYVA